MGNIEQFNYLITFEDDTQVMCQYLGMYKECEYILGKYYYDGDEDDEVLILKILEDGYIEFLEESDVKEEVMLYFENGIQLFM